MARQNPPTLGPSARSQGDLGPGGEPNELVARLASLAFIDGHCHGLVADWTAAAGEPPRWRQCFTEAVAAASLEHDVVAMRGYREFLRALGRRLAVPAVSGSVETDLAEQRDLLARTSDAYLTGLLDEAAIAGFVVDTGFGGDRLSPEAFAGVARRPVWTVIRVESVAEDCLRSLGVDATPARFADEFRAAVEAALDGGAVGLKTIAAYRSGLWLPRPSAAALRRAFRDPVGQAIRLSDPALVSLVVWTAAEIAARRAVPLQVHTGFGDPDLYLPGADPSLLTPLLTDASVEACPIVLLHCYPFVGQAAYLASAFAQVHVDLSLTIPLLGAHGAHSAIAEAMALCPVTKLLAGTDGHSFPEMHWRGARLWRDSLAAVLGQEVASDRLEVEEAVEMGAAILAGNARRLYRLPAG